jgi:hypothetical protein
MIMDDEQKTKPVEDPTTQASGAETAETTVRRGLIGVARGGDVDVAQSIAGVVAGRGGTSFRQGMAGAVVSGGDTQVTQAFTVALPTLGDADLRLAAAQWVLSAGDVSFEKGGCAAAVAPSVSVHSGVVGAALGWKVELGEGARVLLTPRTAAIAGAALGVAFGAAFAISAVAGGARLMARRG